MSPWAQHCAQCLGKECLGQLCCPPGHSFHPRGSPLLGSSSESSGHMGGVIETL